MDKQPVQVLSFKKQSLYFVGSSRVMCGIDPELITKPSNVAEVYNVGIGAHTFLHNMILADRLIQHFKAKELYIELSMIHLDKRDEHKQFGISSSEMMALLPIRDRLKVMDGELFRVMSFTSVLKKPLEATKHEASFGYLYNTENEYDSLVSFIRPLSATSKKVDVSKYLHLMDQLHALARKEGVKLQYFLPLTYLREKERDIVEAVYRQLPDSMKVAYPQEFLEKICKSTNLWNKNHFNRKGALIMSDFFSYTINYN